MNKKRKKIIIKTFVLLSVFLLALVLLPPLAAYADKSLSGEENKLLDELDKETDWQLKQFNWKELEDFLTSIEENTLIKSGVLDTIKQILKGELEISAQSYLLFLSDMLLGGFLSLLPSLITVIVVSVLLGLFSRRKDILSASTGEVVHFVGYAIIITSVLIPVWKLADSAGKTIGDIKTLTNIIMPLLLTLMTAVGARAGVAAMQPSLALFCGGIIELVSKCILPLAVMAIVFCVVANMSENIRLNKFAEFFRHISTVILSIVFTIFTAFLTVKGVTAGVTDGISIRAVKFATRNYLPIVGGYIAEGFDLILAGSILIKNAVGVTGLILILLLITAPVIKILLYSLAIQFTAAVIEPVGDSRVVSFLTDCSKSLTILYVCIIAVAFMFFLLCMLAICTANSL